MPHQMMPPDEVKIERLGEKLQTIRERTGLTLDQMGAILGRTEEARRSRVREWEIGRRIPDIFTIVRYARFAGISTDVLLDDEQDLPPLEDSE